MGVYGNDFNPEYLPAHAHRKCMTFMEYESRIRRGSGAEVMNTFRKLALNIVRMTVLAKPA